MPPGPGVVGRVSVSGAHLMLFSRDAEATRAFLRDVLGLRRPPWWVVGERRRDDRALHQRGQDGELLVLVDLAEAAADQRLAVAESGRRRRRTRGPIASFVFGVASCQS